MIKEEIIERLAVLLLVLQYRSENPEVFTDGQQICINQERGHYMSINFPLRDDDEEYTKYIQPEHLELKISETIATIKKDKWQPKVENEY